MLAGADGVTDVGPAHGRAGATTLEDDDVADLTGLHEELAAVAMTGRPLADVLGEITAIARRAMPGSESVSITLLRGDDPFTAAHEGQMALDADELQYERGYGPCLDAGRSGLVFLIDDMRTDDRWPDYTRHAAEHGIGSSLSVPLPFQAGTLGALNNYSTRPHAFGDEDVELATHGRALGRVRREPRVAGGVRGRGDGEHDGRDGHPRRDRAGEGHPHGAPPAHGRPGVHPADQGLPAHGVKLRDVADELVRTGALPGAR